VTDYLLNGWLKNLALPGPSRFPEVAQVRLTSGDGKEYAESKRKIIADQNNQNIRRTMLLILLLWR